MITICVCMREEEEEEEETRLAVSRSAGRRFARKYRPRLSSSIPRRSMVIVLYM